MTLRSVLSLVLILPAACRADEPATRPARILLIRHAEKPADDSGHLSAAGKRRAEALHGLFEKSDARPEPLPLPDVVFAAANSKRSNRSVETVTPLVKAKKLPLDVSYANGDFARLAKRLLRDPKLAGKTVLVAWHHGTLAEFAGRLGVRGAKEWKDRVFDRVWEVTFDKDGNAKLRDLPQRLMPGDSEK